MVYPSLPCAWGCADPQRRLSHPLPSRCCPRGPTCRASAPPTAGATGAASKPPGEGWPSGEVTMEGSTRGCEGGRTGEWAGGFLAYLGQDPCGTGCPQDEDSCSFLWPCLASRFCSSNPGEDGGGLRQEYPPGDLC